MKKILIALILIVSASSSAAITERFPALYKEAGSNKLIRETTNDTITHIGQNTFTGSHWVKHLTVTDTISAPVMSLTQLTVTDLTVTDTSSFAGASTFADSISLGDDDGLLFGAVPDAWIFWVNASSDFEIQSTGNLVITSTSDMSFLAGVGQFIKFSSNADATLWLYDGATTGENQQFRITGDVDPTGGLDREYFYITTGTSNTDAWVNFGLSNSAVMDGFLFPYDAMPISIGATANDFTLQYDGAISGDAIIATAAGNIVLKPAGRLVSIAGVTESDSGYNYDDNILTVGDAGSEYSTITAALAAASSGDVVLVMPGTYAEKELTIPDGVTLRGADRNRTIISVARTTNL